MTRYIALLRAINVGGTGKLPMSDLRAICEDAGFARVQTYIASGNVLKGNPFPKAESKHTYAIFLNEPPPADALASVSGQHDEEVRLGKKEIFVHYPTGMGRSKLRIPAAKRGTARNMNTVAKLVELASK